jgi:carboxylesterase
LAEGGGAALALHGFTGSTHSLGGVPAALARAGLAVGAPMLAGHGTVVDDLDDKRWPDWLVTAERAYDELAAAHDRVVVFGLSMGGALACRLACERPVAGLALLNPLIDPPAESFRQALRGVIDAGFPRAPGIAGDIADPEAEEVGYPELPLAALLSVCEGLDELLPRLGSVTCPVLVMTSREDHVVPTVSSDIVAARVGGPVERVWLERSYHVATLDHDRHEVERLTVAFALRVAAG